METLFVGKNIIFLPETLSTNSHATELLKNVNLSEGTVVHTLNQKAGKGQRGTVWIAEPASNFTASVILKPAFLDVKLSYFLYIIAALAAYDTTAEILNPSQFDIKIKWPNDIMVNRKKIAGILIENKLQEQRFSNSVIGVGLNINQNNFQNLNATSISLLTGKAYDIQKCLSFFCVYLEKYYLMLKNQKFVGLKQLYSERLFGKDEVIDFVLLDGKKSMRVLGISDNGRLQLQDCQHNKIEVDVKDIKWLI